MPQKRNERDKFYNMRTIVPEGRVGVAEVVHFSMDRDDCAMASIRGDYVYPGDYCRLMVRGHTVMSDTPMEHRTNWEVLRKAKGDVLIAGLGLGMILHPIWEKDEVASVTVIEESADVIALVGPTVPDGVEIIHADIMQWRPAKGVKFDCIYFDIWPDICEDNLEEISKLHRAFARRKTEDGWMNSWQAENLRARRRRNVSY